MRKLKVYLDTSILSFNYANDSPFYAKITSDFFNNYIDEFDIYISDVVLLEIEKNTNLELKNKMLKLVEKYNIKILDTKNDNKIIDLAKKYINESVIPKNKIEDALHLAVTTINELDILLSWNFRHLANIKKQMQINSINEREGYLKKLNLLSLLEVEYEK